MKTTVILMCAVVLTGCAQPPRLLASWFDHGDPCQARAELNRPQGYQIPSWCGSGSYGRATARIGNTASAQLPSTYIAPQR